MQITKQKPSGAIATTYTGEVAEIGETSIVIDARWERTNTDLGYTVFVTGDRFTEYFYADQWFNVIRIDDGRTGALKGWYCNIACPAIITDTTIDYRDLYLDVWVDPAGVPLILDEDEFAAADLDADLQVSARAGLTTLLGWISAREGPFLRIE